ncbi:hypothetical protein K438DRAFT_2063734 [Mycena galopus ATCC 62051]|nr:hypothetical protein K438DRAFT_2063734 [Mycena galopus ATCC 62051]
MTHVRFLHLASHEACKTEKRGMRAYTVPQRVRCWLRDLLLERRLACLEGGRNLALKEARRKNESLANEMNQRSEKRGLTEERRAAQTAPRADEGGAGRWEGQEDGRGRKMGGEDKADSDDVSTFKSTSAALFQEQILSYLGLARNYQNYSYSLSYIVDVWSYGRITPRVISHSVDIILGRIRSNTTEALDLDSREGGWICEGRKALVRVGGDSRTVAIDIEEVAVLLNFLGLRMRRGKGAPQTKITPWESARLVEEQVCPADTWVARGSIEVECSASKWLCIPLPPSNYFCASTATRVENDVNLTSRVRTRDIRNCRVVGICHHTLSPTGCSSRSRMDQACHRAFLLKPNVLANGVQHVMLPQGHWPTEDTHALLRLCGPRLLSLAGIHQPELLSALSHLSQLRRWSGNLECLFGGYPAIDLSSSAFRTLTHMDIWDGIGTDDAVICPGLAALPCLTHLSLPNCRYGHVLVPRIFVQCLHLQVLLSTSNTAEILAANPPTKDMRFVFSFPRSYWKDWEVGTRGAIDIWAAADEFVARKRRGEIEAHNRAGQNKTISKEESENGSGPGTSLNLPVLVFSAIDVARRANFLPSASRQRL